LPTDGYARQLLRAVTLKLTLAFIPLALPAAPMASPSPADQTIKIELRKGVSIIVVTWPLSA
jgi:hypothetical protein